MAARASVQSLLEAEVAEGESLHALGFTNVYASNSLDTPPEHQFIVVRWEDWSPQFYRHGPQRLTIWLHTKDLDYADIDKGLEIVKDLMGSAVHLPGSDGWTLTQADWRGDSQDLIDDGFGTLTRNSAFDAVSRYSSV